MSEAQEANEYERSDEEKLKALIRKDIDPDITRTVENLLEKLQEEGS